jgi:hypothetical protein
MPSNVESIAGLVRTARPAERLAADAPMRLDTYDGFFLVRAGYVDLFVVPLIDGEPIGARRHVLRVPSGRLVGGLPAMGTPPSSRWAGSRPRSSICARSSR